MGIIVYDKGIIWDLGAVVKSLTTLTWFCMKEPSYTTILIKLGTSRKYLKQTV